MKSIMKSLIDFTLIRGLQVQGKTNCENKLKFHEAGPLKLVQFFDFNE